MHPRSYTPTMPLTRIEELLAGVTRFETDVFPGQREHFEDLAHGQEPSALFITCSDSRVLPNLITQTRPGELFLCRDIGNIVPAHGAVYGGVSATIEYSVSVLRVPHVIICGHSDCGAIRCLLEPERLQGLSSVTQWLQPRRSGPPDRHRPPPGGTAVRPSARAGRAERAEPAGEPAHPPRCGERASLRGTSRCTAGPTRSRRARCGSTTRRRRRSGRHVRCWITRRRWASTEIDGKVLA